MWNCLFSKMWVRKLIDVYLFNLKKTSQLLQMGKSFTPVISKQIFSRAGLFKTFMSHMRCVRRKIFLTTSSFGYIMIMINIFKDMEKCSVHIYSQSVYTNSIILFIQLEALYITTVNQRGHMINNNLSFVHWISFNFIAVYRMTTVYL